MKKKILTKHILMALAMAAMVPIGQAWAWEVSEDGKTLTSSENETLDLIKKSPVKGTKLSQFTTIKIDHTANLAQRDFAAVITGTNSKVNLDQTNFYITVNKKEQNENADGLHITGNNTEVTIGDFSGAIYAAKSDGISIGNEAGGSNILNVGSIGQADGLIVDNGNGIRASAVSDKYVTDKTFTGYKSVINVEGATNITINGEMIEKSAQLSSITVSGKYAPAAVYAGDDMYYFDFFTSFGNQSIGQGIISLNDTTLTILKGQNNQGGYGLYAGKNGTIKVNGDLNIISVADNSYGIAAKDSNLVYGNTFKVGSLIEMPNLDHSANTHGTSVMLGEGKDVSISMQGDNSYAMYAEGVDNTTEHKANSITGKELNTLYAVGDMLVENGGLIDLGTTGEKTDNNGNSWGAYQLGAVIASGTNKVSDTKSTYSLSSANANYILSKSVIADAGDLGDSDMSDKQVISALYAEDGADIEISSGQSNTFLTTANPTNPDQLERVIWAYNGADITVGGTTTISTDSYEKSANSADIAIAAGTAVNLTKEKVESAVANPSSIDHAVVTVNYDSYVDNAGTTVASSITGDIVSAYAGQVNIKKQDGAANAKINIEGNLLAGNGGILNVDLGNGGVLKGRADDYGDAGVVTHDSSYGEDGSFRHPAFSSDIYKGGAVNLTMGEGARWNVMGQSWVTSIDTNSAAKTEDILKAEDPIKAMENMATIDLVSANTDRNTYAHALTIYKMNGDAVFNMNLDGDRTVSDMLYMKKADGNYIINVVDPVTLDDMYAKRENGELFNGLRFATVGAGSNVTFRAVTVDQGVLNVEYEVGTDSYDGNDENGEYNSTAEDGTSGNAEKPGDAMVDGFFESDKEPVGSSDNTASSADYMTLSETGTEEDSGTDTQTDAVNYKLIGRADEQISSAGKAIVAMSKVNYSNAVYMDRLNKRVGEARYLDGDDGLWVRLRHDRIGKDDAFRSLNTMFELGYDRKVQDQKDGEHRRGVAFDYMRGEADYTNVMGSGDVRRAGVWLYDTWLGDKGHYSDYVLKYGHLSNDFDIFAPTTADKISGDYDNDVWSASAEYGRKKDIGSEWYFEPQAQLQYAYVTSADYTTSQNTKVSLDGIDSLIGRAGFRLGRDTSEGNTVYFKADILHEFLGDQRVHASDITGALDTTYDNEGTWYDVGFGFSHRMGEDSYMFLDVEHSFGNDNEDTYQINIGLNRAF